MVGDGKVKRESFSRETEETHSQTAAALQRAQEAFRLVDMAEAMAGVGHWRLDATTSTGSRQE